MGLRDVTGCLEAARRVVAASLRIARARRPAEPADFPGALSAGGTGDGSADGPLHGGGAGTATPAPGRVLRGRFHTDVVFLRAVRRARPRGGVARVRPRESRGQAAVVVAS